MSGASAAQAQTPHLGVLRRLGPFVREHVGLLLVAGVTLPILAGAQLVGPYLLRVALDQHIVPAVGTANPDLSGLWAVIAVFLGVQVGEVVLRFVQLYLMQLAGQRIMHDLRRAVFDHIQRLPMAYFDRNPIGKVMTRVTSDVETLNELMSQGIVAMARDLVTLVGIVVVMAWIDWRLTLASFVVFPFLLVILAALRVRLRRTYDLSRTLVAQLNTFLQESITGMTIVQAFSQEARNVADFAGLRGELLRVDLRGVRLSSFLSATVQAATTISTALVLAYGGFGIIGSTVTVGLLVQFLEYLRRFYMPIEDLSDKYDSLQRAAAATKKIFAVLDEPPAPHDRSLPAQPPLERELRFENVSFAYPGSPDVPVLQGFDLTVRRGEKVAIVGTTGAGKSSVVKLLQRLYEPQTGRITLDGIDIREFNVAALRRNLGIVPQDVFLFTDTIADNIGLSSERGDRAAVERAADTVEASELIDDLPDGFDTRLGERGANLSFGERQLLAFARAVVNEPEILILDEATSSVDSETEGRIQRALPKTVADRTAIIIAHRLSTIREVDRIVVLHRGAIREQGSHQELLARDGIYATLYRLQYEAAAAGSS